MQLEILAMNYNLCINSIGQLQTQRIKLYSNGKGNLSKSIVE